MFLGGAAVHAGRVKDAREVIAGLEAEAATTPAPTLPRTAGSDLYRIFPKLEVTSRAQLAAKLGQDKPAAIYP